MFMMWKVFAIWGKYNTHTSVEEPKDKIDLWFHLLDNKKAGLCPLSLQTSINNKTLFTKAKVRKKRSNTWLWYVKLIGFLDSNIVI